MSRDVNKHGLKRYIPSDVKAIIRKEAGYGCVICGCVFVDYEHIEPEWHDAYEHDPSKMTLLCPDCHTRVTRKLLSKKRVWEAKDTPKALENGFVHDVLSTDNNNLEIKFASIQSQNIRVLLRIYNKPMIWFEKSEEIHEPYKLCAIFTDSIGRLIAYINRNQFIAFSKNYDIKSEATRLSIKADKKIILEIDRKADQCLHITKIDCSYLDQKVISDEDNNIVFKQGDNIFGTIGNLEIALIDEIGNNTATALSFGKPLARKIDKQQFKIANLVLNPVISVQIYNSTGKLKGWRLNNQIYNLNYEQVGYCKVDEVYNIVDEFIGYLKQNSIVYPENSYETGEPIYISDQNKAFRMLNKTGYFDVSFRLFEDTY